jgi:hypothetical protein
MRNYQCDPSAVEILLIRNVPIDRDQYVEARGLGGGQQLSVFEAGKVGVTDCFTVVPGK